MPNHKSAEKRVRTNEKARQRNMAERSKMRGAIKAVRTAKTRAESDGAYVKAASILDRTVSKGIIKKETASRHKARLARFTQTLSE